MEPITLWDKNEIAVTYMLDESVGSGACCKTYSAHGGAAAGKVLLKKFQPRYCQKGSNSYDQKLERFRNGLAIQEAMLNDDSTVNATVTLRVLHDAEGALWSECIYRAGRVFDGGAERTLYELLRFAHHLAQALNGVHKKNIYLIDIKPENIFELQADAGVYGVSLFDFDSCISLDELESKSVPISGTKGWSAPEVMDGRYDEIGACSDWYSLGEIVFYSLFGRHSDLDERTYDAYYDFDEAREWYALDLTKGIRKRLSAFFRHTLTDVAALRYTDGKQLIDALRTLEALLARPNRFITNIDLDAGSTQAAKLPTEFDKIRRFFTAQVNEPAVVLMTWSIPENERSPLLKSFASGLADSYHAIEYTSYSPQESFNRVFDQVMCSELLNNSEKRQLLIDPESTQRVLLIIDGLDMDNPPTFPPFGYTHVLLVSGGAGQSEDKLIKVELMQRRSTPTGERYEPADYDGDNEDIVKGHSVVKRSLIFGVCTATVVLTLCILLAWGKSKPPQPVAVPPADISQAMAEPISEDDSSVEILLRLLPNSAANYSDVQHDTPIVKDRIMALSADAQISVNSQDGNIDAVIPLEAMGSADIDALIKAAVSRPLELYFIKIDGWNIYTETEAVIGREEIKDISVVTALEAQERYSMPPSYLDSYGKELSFYPDQPAIVIELTEEAAAKADPLSDCEGTLGIGTDAQIHANDCMYFPYLFEAADNATFVAVPVLWQQRSLAEALARAYSGETLHKSYTYSYELSPNAYWQDIDTVEYPGDFQTDIGELTDNTVTLSFLTVSPDEVSEKSYDSVVRRFRDVFDIIGEPYAIGRNVRDERSIAVCTSPSKLNSKILEFAVSGPMEFTAENSESWTCWLDAESVQIVNVGGPDVYGLCVQMSDPGALESITSSILNDCTDKSMYLGWHGTDVLAADISEIIYDGKLIFTRIPVALQSQIGQDHKYILELAEYSMKRDYPQAYYFLNESTFSESGGKYGVTRLTPKEQNVPALIKSEHPEVDAWVSDKDLKELVVLLHTEIQPDFLSTAFSLAKSIIESTEIESLSFESIIFQLIDEGEGERCRLVFGSDMVCVSSCHGGLLDSYREDFTRLAEQIHFKSFHLLDAF